MTLLMVWTNKPEKPTCLYIASDSKLSGDAEWEYATKIFRLYPTHEYVGYCGWSLPALAFIHQGTALLYHTDILSKSGNSATASIQGRVKALILNLQQAFSSFPEKWMQTGATVIYGGYDHRLKRFRVFTIGLQQATWAETELDLAAKRVYCFGSEEARGDVLVRAAGQPIGTTEILNILKLVIADSTRKTVGGPPQMVQILSDKSWPIGFQWAVGGCKQNVLFGVPVQFRRDLSAVKFLSEEFQEIKKPQSARIAPAGRAIPCPALSDEIIPLLPRTDTEVGSTLMWSSPEESPTGEVYFQCANSRPRTRIRRLRSAERRRFLGNVGIPAADSGLTRS